MEPDQIFPGKVIPLPREDVLYSVSLDGGSHRHHQESQNRGDEPQAVRLQGSQSGMETEVKGHVESEEAGHTAHLSREGAMH